MLGLLPTYTGLLQSRELFGQCRLQLFASGALASAYRRPYYLDELFIFTNLLPNGGIHAGQTFDGQQL